MTAVDDATVKQFGQMVETLMNDNNEMRSQAEEAYNNARKTNPDTTMSCMLVHLRSNPVEQVRSMCAVLLRKFAASLGSSDSNKPDAQPPLSAAGEAHFKQELLACMQSEQVRHIRKKVCDAVGQYGVSLLSKNLAAWPDLLAFLVQSVGLRADGSVIAEGSDPNLHEAALLIFSALAELIAENEHMKAFHPTLLQVFRVSLQPDKAIAIRSAALKALASFLLTLRNAQSRNAFQELVPMMMSTIEQTMLSGDEVDCRTAIEVFVEIVEYQPKFLKNHVETVVSGMIQISSNTNLEDGTRHIALEFLVSVAEHMSGAAKKIDLCANTVPVALNMMLELECDSAAELAEWENEEEDEESEDVTTYDVGEEALDRLAMATGGKIMVPVLFAKVQELIRSTEWKHRHAALMAISQSGEGCSEQMKNNLNDIVKMIVDHFGDAHPRVRWAAINTVGQMCTDFGPGLQNLLHDHVVPGLVKAMDDTCKRVQAHAAAAVINFCEHCERALLKPYLNDVLGKLMLLLQKNIRRVSEQAVTAIASIADVAESDFQPFYASFIPGLKAILANQDKENRMLRGKAMECISLIGNAVGADIFMADAKEVMELIIASQQGQVMEPDDPQISYMLQACGRICKCLGEHFKPYLAHVLPPLLRSAQTNPEVSVTDADDDDEEEEEDGFESVTVNVRGQGNKRITIRTSALEEKETACTMLKQYAQDLGEGFFPYVEQVAQVLVPLISFQYMDDIRVSSAQAMPYLLHASIKAREADMTDDGFIAKLKDYIYAPLFQQLKTEPDTDTLAMLVDVLTEFIQHGDESLPSRMNAEQLTEALNLCHELMKESMERRAGKANENAEDADEDDEDMDPAESEEILVQNIVESLGALIKIFKSSMLTVFQNKFGPELQSMLKPDAVDSDRIAALCIVDDVIEHCSADGGSAPLIPVFLPILKGHALSEAVGVRQAAVYGLGVWAEHDVQSSSQTPEEHMTVAQILLQVVEHPQAFKEDNATASDNAVSALGKLCKRSEAVGNACLPRWLRLLPLQADIEEARSVHTMLVGLVEQTNTMLLGAGMERLPDVLIIFGKLLGTSFVEEEAQTRMAGLVKQVAIGMPQVLQGLPGHPQFKDLTDQQKAALEQAVSS